jgi:hypothetical protein
METTIVAATIAVLTGLMGLGIFLAYRAYRRGSKQPQATPDPSTITAKIDTAIPRPPKVVRAPEGCKKFLTAGKEYPVIGIWCGYDPTLGYGFKITTDLGDSYEALEMQCSSLNGGDWIIVEREGEDKQEPPIEQQLFEAQAEATRLAGELELQKKNTEHCKESFEYYYKRKKEAVQERDEARALANDLSTQLDRALAVIKDLEAINAELLAMVQGEDGQPATTEPAIDWTKPVAFPQGYRIPKGVRVIVVDENKYVKVGSKGTTIDTCDIPNIAFDGEKSNWAKNERSNTPALLSERLAPENPADHPWHPEFKGKN